MQWTDLHTIRTIKEQSLEFQTPFVVNFIDVMQALSVQRESLREVAKLYGIPGKYKMASSGHCIRILDATCGCQTKAPMTGVRERCVLSQFLHCRDIYGRCESAEVVFAEWPLIGVCLCMLKYHDTNRPSSSISRHIAVDLYRTLWTADEHSVDAVWMFTGCVDLRTVTWFICQ